MAQARDERHRYGQHYTPREVARVLAAFAVRSSSDFVFDPSCGDGRLLAEALDRMQLLAAQSNLTLNGLNQKLFGLDRSGSAVEVAAATGARAARADFFEVEPGALLDDGFRLPASFDAIIGNPPYIRQEVMGAPDKQRIKRQLDRARAQTPEVFWPRWSGRSDIYVFFFAHAIRFLKAGGRLVFLTASSWLDVGYGGPLRDFLRENFRIIAVVESAIEAFFSDASINTAITVLEREADARARENHSVRFIQLTRPLAEILATRPSGASEFAGEIEQARSCETGDAYRIRLVNQRALGAEARDARATPSGWGKYLRADDVFFRVLERGGRSMLPLTQVARVRFGVKTGANEFFYVSGAGAEKGKGGLLALGEVASVRRGLTTGANEFFYVKVRSEGEEENRRAGEQGERGEEGQRSRGAAGTGAGPVPLCPSAHSPSLLLIADGSGAHRQIESRYLSAVIFSLKEIPQIWLEEARGGKMLFNCPDARADLAGTQALEHIESGERAGYHRRPTCASRNPWYSVVREMKPAPLIFPSKVGERWVVAVNRARVFEDKKLYGIFPRRRVSVLLVAALLNSTWARYYSEVTCRQMTGAQAIADIDVAVAERIMLPDPRGLSRELRSKLEAAVKALARRPILSIFEEVTLADRRILDELVLRAIGFTNRIQRGEVLEALYSAVTTLVRQRLARSRSGRGE